MKAFLLNKIGDLFLIAGITLLLLITDATSFGVIFLCAAHMPSYLLEIISALLVVGAGLATCPEFNWYFDHYVNYFFYYLIFKANDFKYGKILC